jgi:hypothetical protein
MSVKVDDVRCDRLISRFFSDVLHDEDAIESGKDRALEVDLFCCVFQVIITTEDRVGGC